MNLNKIAVFLFILLGLISAKTFAQSYDIVRIQKLVAAAEEHAHDSGCNNAGMFMDNYRNLHKHSVFQALQNDLRNSWRFVLSNLDAVTESDMSKAIVLCSCWILSEEDYISFLQTVTTLAENGGLDRNLLRWCQNPVESDLAGFLVKNAQIPRVRDVILRTKALFSDIPERELVYNQMLSGEARAKLELHEQAMADKPAIEQIATTVHKKDLADVFQNESPGMQSADENDNSSFVSTPNTPKRKPGEKVTNSIVSSHVVVLLIILFVFAIILFWRFIQKMI